MLGQTRIFNWKSKREQDAEEEAYEKWAFPYGTAQREKLQALLLELFPKESAAMTLIPFLTCKELFEDARREHETDELTARHLIYEVKKYKSVIRKDEMRVYTALVLADRRAGESLEYPPADEIRRGAAEI